SLLPIRVSEDTSRFRYTNPTGHPSRLRIAHIARAWCFVGDDCALPDNLVAVLGKSVGGRWCTSGPRQRATRPTTTSATAWRSEEEASCSASPSPVRCEHFGVCIERYPGCMGDDRLHACIHELGVPLSREYGFHQWDIRGNVHGILAAHPIAPFISIHHVEFVDPIYPRLNYLESLELFTKAIVLLPPELERSERTYVAFNRMSQRTELDFDTKEIQKSMCKKPVLFFLKDVWKDRNITRGSYIRSSERDYLKRKVFCFRSPPLSDIDEIQVFASPLSKRWHLVPFGSASDSLD
ncbi:hypothetical protein ZWY2020_057376, partial [Hordeum vulgare]